MAPARRAVAIQDREHGQAVYLRLTTKGVDQALRDPAVARLGEATLRAQVLDGGYRLVDHEGQPGYEPGANVVNLVATGAMVPEAVAASRLLADDGILANVLVLTSPRLAYEAWRERLRPACAGRPGRQSPGRAARHRGRDRGRDADRERARRPLPRARVARVGARRATGSARGRRIRPVRRPGRPLPPLRDRRGGASGRPPARPCRFVSRRASPPSGRARWSNQCLTRPAPSGYDCENPRLPCPRDASGTGARLRRSR